VLIIQILYLRAYILITKGDIHLLLTIYMYMYMYVYVYFNLNNITAFELLN